MLSAPRFSLFASTVLYLVASTAACAADTRPQSISAVPGKEVCSFTSATLGDKRVRPQVCVIRGNFSSDMYALKIDGKVVVHGIDDQTTAGISATFENRTLQLRCVPQEVFPKATPEETLAEVRRVLPEGTEARVKELAELLGTGSGTGGMELGRLCTGSADGNALIAVQVNFD